MIARCARCQGTFTTDRFGVQTCPHCGSEILLSDPAGGAPAGPGPGQAAAPPPPPPPAPAGEPSWGAPPPPPPPGAAPPPWPPPPPPPPAGSAPPPPPGGWSDPTGGFGQPLVLTACAELHCEDAALEGRLSLEPSPPAAVVGGPHETVSQSEAGLEKIMQGACLRLRWEAPRVRLTLRVAPCPSWLGA